MTWDQLESMWKEYLGSARAHWSRLTEEDWQALDGKRQPLVDRIQIRYEITKDQAEKRVEEWRDALQEIAETSKAH